MPIYYYKKDKMLKLISTCVVVFASLTCLSQNKPSYSLDTVQYKVLYSFKQLMDTNNINNFYNEEMVLLIGKQFNVYKSLQLDKYETELANQLNTAANDIKAGKSPQYNLQKLGRVTTNAFFKSTNNSFIYITTELAYIKYLVEDNCPRIQWKINNIQKTIKGFHCQNASGYFRGRTYEVWFTTEIPISSGPWKLFGLPGLILEASDIKKQVQFHFINLEKATLKQIEIIKLPQYNKLLYRKDWIKLYKAYQEDPMSFLQNTLPAGVKVHVDINNKPLNAKAIFNNPIELPEKQ
ncbi:MAG: GLPGLI family protein [Bacteroidetes bacterium]|nr:GLPGLI family protein [Bacteroidota bacterium]MBS1670288.1 GLPGLI family protein [Bacteroidota bacterium]